MHSTLTTVLCNLFLVWTVVGVILKYQSRPVGRIVGNLMVGLGAVVLIVRLAITSGPTGQFMGSSKMLGYVVLGLLAILCCIDLVQNWRNRL
jgi:hypothetical protein